MWNPFRKYNVSHFRPRGLIFDKDDYEVTLSSDQSFLAPRKIDNRDMCLASSNQGNTPHCAGYAVAGYLEFQNWKEIHYPRQVDGDAIYEAAKSLELFGGEGTTLQNAVRGARKLGLTDKKFSKVSNGRLNIKFSLHKYGVCLGGFNITTEWDYVELKTGNIRVRSDAKILGGHAVLLCGYDDYGVYIQNSWGESWGIHGFGRLSWAQCDKQFIYGGVFE